MKTVLKVKLLTNKESHSALWRTMRAFNFVCNQLSKQAFDSKTYNKIQIQREFYQGHRETMPKFSSQLLIRAMDVVAQSYKTKRTKKSNFFSQASAVVYDARCLTLKEDSISIWTSNGRLNIPIQVYNKELFKFRQGQIDLVCQNKQFYLLVTLELPEPLSYDAEDVIGVDLGVKNIAVDSTGKIFTSDIVENKRKKYHSYRQRLQERGTRSAKRRLKSFGKKESRFRKDINHQISKYLISKAKGTLSAIALEDIFLGLDITLP
jgi:predicted transposase